MGYGCVNAGEDSARRAGVDPRTVGFVEVSAGGELLATHLPMVPDGDRLPGDAGRIALGAGVDLATAVPQGHLMVRIGGALVVRGPLPHRRVH